MIRGRLCQRGASIKECVAKKNWSDLLFLIKTAHLQTRSNFGASQRVTKTKKSMNVTYLITTAKHEKNKRHVINIFASKFPVSLFSQTTIER